MTTLLLALSLFTSVFAATPCVSCYRPLDRAVFERLTGLKLDVPTRVDVLAQLRAFDAQPEAQRLSEPHYDVGAAAGYLVTDPRRRQVVRAFTRLEVADIHVDVDHARAIRGGVEVAFVASVDFARADRNRAGQVWVHGRVRATDLQINKHERKTDLLNAALASAVVIDALVGDRGLAANERARRDLVREVLFPAVVAQGYAPIMNLWVDQVTEWLTGALPKAIEKMFGSHGADDAK